MEQENRMAWFIPSPQMAVPPSAHLKNLLEISVLSISGTRVRIQCQSREVSYVDVVHQCTQVGYRHAPALLT